jgi:hypothetical protein
MRQLMAQDAHAVASVTMLVKTRALQLTADEVMFGDLCKSFEGSFVDREACEQVSAVACLYCSLLGVK